MKLLENAGTFEILSKTEDVLGAIALAARTCYQSQDKQSEKSDKFLIKALLDRGHTAMIEFADMTVRFNNICRGFSHEAVRHRLCSFGQECLTGDTNIKTGSKTITIEELYNRQNGTCYDKTHNKTLTIKSINKKGEIIFNKMIDVFSKGEQLVYEITTELGYKIKSTLNHRFVNKNKDFSELKNFQVGDAIYVNGTPSLIKVTKEEMERLYNDVELSPIEIAEELDVGYRNVIHTLKTMGIFVPRKNDKNKEKYNKNHTKESYMKIRKTIGKQYKEGRKVWNKGLTENDHPGVKRQANNLRKNHHNNESGEKNSSWKGDFTESISTRRSRFSNYEKEKCELCGDKINLENHHKDENPKNWKKHNKETLCTSCHKLKHFGWHVGKKMVKDKIISIKKIGIRKVFDIEMKKPFNNFIANGFIVHNSTRYVDESDFLTVVPPHHSKWFNGTETQSNHKVTLELPKSKFDSHARTFDVDLKEWFELNEQMYKGLRTNPEGKMKPEDARQVLPIAIKTQLVVKANMTEWRHIFKMRCDKYAHWEIRGVMLNLLTEVKKRVPLIFDDYKFFETEDGKEYARPVLSEARLIDAIKHYMRSGGSTEKIKEMI